MRIRQKIYFLSHPCLHKRGWPHFLADISIQYPKLFLSFLFPHSHVHIHIFMLLELLCEGGFLSIWPSKQMYPSRGRAQLTKIIYQSSFFLLLSSCSEQKQGNNSLDKNVLQYTSTVRYQKALCTQAFFMYRCVMPPCNKNFLLEDSHFPHGNFQG